MFKGRMKENRIELRDTSISKTMSRMLTSCDLCQNKNVTLSEGVLTALTLTTHDNMYEFQCELTQLR